MDFWGLGSSKTWRACYKAEIAAKINGPFYMDVGLNVLLLKTLKKLLRNTSSIREMYKGVK